MTGKTASQTFGPHLIYDADNYDSFTNDEMTALTDRIVFAIVTGNKPQQADLDSLSDKIAAEQAAGANDHDLAIIASSAPRWRFRLAAIREMERRS